MADRNGHCSPTLERFLALYDNSRIVDNSSVTKLGKIARDLGAIANRADSIIPALCQRLQRL